MATREELEEAIESITGNVPRIMCASHDDGTVHSIEAVVCRRNGRTCCSFSRPVDDELGALADLLLWVMIIEAGPVVSDRSFTSPGWQDRVLGLMPDVLAFMAAKALGGTCAS